MTSLSFIDKQIEVNENGIVVEGYIDKELDWDAHATAITPKPEFWFEPTLMNFTNQLNAV